MNLHLVVILCVASFELRTALPGIKSIAVNEAINISNPGYVNFIFHPRSVDLSITTFTNAIPEPGKIHLVENISSYFSGQGRDITAPTLVGTGYQWPNKIELIPDGIFTRPRRVKLCRPASSRDCLLFLVPDGFLSPGRQTGGVYIQPVEVSSSFRFHGDFIFPPVQLAPIEPFHYYFTSNWFDLDQDGKQDLVLPRITTELFDIDGSRGDLVWLKQPTDPSDINKPWELNFLTSGPDVMILMNTIDAKSKFAEQLNCS